MASKPTMTVAFLLLVSLAVYAQPDMPTDVGDAVEERDDAPRESTTPVEGDVVVFHSGRQLRGVRVVRESPIYVDVEYLPGEPVLQLPRSQVDYVEYAHDRGARGQAGAAADFQSGPDVMPGEEVSVEFHRQLMTPLSQEELVFEDADYLDVLRNLAAQTGITLQVGKRLRDTPREERLFSRIIAPETPLMAFLRRDMVDIAPEVRVILRFDKLVLQKREAAAATTPVPETTPDSPAVPESDETPAE